MENAPCERAIIETISFFSLFEYPLTASELSTWIKSDKLVSAGEVYRDAWRLAQEERGLIGFKNGFFFLCGHETSVEHRMQNFLTHLPKFFRARRAVRLISWIPFVRMVAICNTVAMAASNKESDIDFFIVTRVGRIWFVRFLTALALHFAGLRRHGRHIANRICLSFYAVDSALDLSVMCLPQGDVYLTYWPTQLVLLLNEENTYEKFARANAWVRMNLPNTNFDSAFGDLRCTPCARSARMIRRVGESILCGNIGGALERACRFVQHIKMKYALQGSRPVRNAVIVSDTVLKFHEHDRRQEFHERWLECVFSHQVFSKIIK